MLNYQSVQIQVGDIFLSSRPDKCWQHFDDKWIEKIQGANLLINTLCVCMCLWCAHKDVELCSHLGSCLQCLYYKLGNYFALAVFLRIACVLCHIWKSPSKIKQTKLVKWTSVSPVLSGAGWLVFGFTAEEISLNSTHRKPTCGMLLPFEKTGL